MSEKRQTISLSAASVAAAISVLSAHAALADPLSADVWTGWYAGLNVGGNWGGDPINTSATNSEFCQPCTHSQDTANASIQGATGEFRASLDGFTGGGQLGYNWQLANRWVTGFEADLQGMIGAEDSSSRTSSHDVAGLAGQSVATDLSVSKSIDYLGTLRGRLGYLVEPNLMIFGTGGFAYGQVNADTRISQTLIGVTGGLDKNWSADSSVTTLLGGWTVGGGLEWAFAPNWTANVTYLYYDLGEVTSNGQLVNRLTGPTPVVPYYFVNDAQTTTRFNGNLVRVALSYHF